MKRKFARWVALLCAVMMILGLCSCGPTSPDVPEDSGTSSNQDLPKVNVTEKKLKILCQSDVSGEVERANAIFGCELEYEPTTVAWTDLGTKLAQMVLGGTPPDVYYSRERDFPLLAKKDLLEPLDDIFDFSGFLFEGCEYTLTGCMYDGKHYAAPARGSFGHVMWYNEKLFKEAGLETPRELYAQGKWDWNAYLNAALEITDKDNGIYGGSGLRALDWWLTTGKDVLTFDENGLPISQLRDPDIMAAMEFWRQLSVGKYNVYSPELQSVELFKTGKIGMMIDGIWLANSQLTDMMIDNSANFAPMPKYPGADKTYQWANYNALSIGKDAANVEGAKAFIYSFLIASNTSKEYKDSIPALKTVSEKNKAKQLECGWDDADFAMYETMQKEIGLSFCPSERVTGYTDYIEWVCCTPMRNTGVSWQTELEVQEEWINDIVNTYKEDVLGIKE